MASPILTGLEHGINVGSDEVFLKVSGQSAEIPFRSSRPFA
jgi:hypothetical protein